jgi:hypothetical protein
MKAIDVLRQQSGENDYQHQLRRVLEFIRSKPDGVPDSKLSEKFESIKRRDLAEIKFSLVESERIIKRKGESSAKGGRPGERWFALAPGDDD